MFQEAEASSSSVIEQLVEKSNEFVEDNCELGDKLESAGMVFVQSLKELGSSSQSSASLLQTDECTTDSTSVIEEKSCNGRANILEHKDQSKGENTTKQSIMEFSRRRTPFWWFRTVTLKFGSGSLVLSNGSIFLGFLAALVYYIVWRKQASLWRFGNARIRRAWNWLIIVKRKASSTKKALVDFWQLAFSYQEVTLEGTSIHDIVHQNSTCGAAENVGTAAKPNGIMHEPPSNMGLRQTIDGRIIKKEPVYGGNSPFAFGPHGSYLESRSAMGDASVSSFSSVESNRQPLNEPLLDADSTSFGFLGEIPQNFGFSDLTADFTNSSDILESYSRTPFLATDTGSLLDSNGGIERLTNASENLRYTNFSGD
ncbi:hypothetical protein BC332_33384 [Capsicum chinense]|nr:hypothetical protein BC332_33384 [Capsicum chinense]